MDKEIIVSVITNIVCIATSAVLIIMGDATAGIYLLLAVIFCILMEISTKITKLNHTMNDANDMHRRASLMMDKVCRRVGIEE